MPRDAQRVQAGGGEAQRRADAHQARADDDRVGALRRRRRMAPDNAARGRGGGATQHSAPLLQPADSLAGWWMGETKPLLSEAVVAEFAAL